jgi:hypothetical protein
MNWGLTPEGWPPSTRLSTHRGGIWKRINIFVNKKVWDGVTGYKKIIIIRRIQIWLKCFKIKIFVNKYKNKKFYRKIKIFSCSKLRSCNKVEVLNYFLTIQWKPLNVISDNVIIW